MIKATVRAFVIMVVAAILIAGVYAAFARELYPGQYQNVSEDVSNWFKSQKIPGKDASCCSEADGTYAEEDIRDGHYWVRFVIKKYNANREAVPETVDWMPVPDEAVIHDSNPHGAAVVWWSAATTYKDGGYHLNVSIRCFAPGAKM